MTEIPVTVVGQSEFYTRGPCSEQGKHVLNNGLVIWVWCGDITAVEAEAVVAGEDSRFSGGGAVARVLLRAGGEVYQQKRNQIKDMVKRQGCNFLAYNCTGGPGLKNKQVIHAILHHDNRNDPFAWSKHLEDVFFQVGFCADNAKVASVAMPLLGAGNAGGDMEVSLQAAVRGLSKVIPKFLGYVILVEFDQEKAARMRRRLEEIVSSTNPEQKSLPDRGGRIAGSGPFQARTTNSTGAGSHPLATGEEDEDGWTHLHIQVEGRSDTEVPPAPGKTPANTSGTQTAGRADSSGINKDLTIFKETNQKFFLKRPQNQDPMNRNIRHGEENATKNAAIINDPLRSRAELEQSASKTFSPAEVHQASSGERGGAEGEAGGGGGGGGGEAGVESPGGINQSTSSSGGSSRGSRAAVHGSAKDEERSAVTTSVHTVYLKKDEEEREVEEEEEREDEGSSPVHRERTSAAASPESAADNNSSTEKARGKPDHTIHRSPRDDQGSLFTASSGGYVTRIHLPPDLSKRKDSTGVIMWSSSTVSGSVGTPPNPGGGLESYDSGGIEQRGVGPHSSPERGRGASKSTREGEEPYDDDNTSNPSPSLTSNPESLTSFPEAARSPSDGGERQEQESSAVRPAPEEKDNAGKDGEVERGNTSPGMGAGPQPRRVDRSSRTFVHPESSDDAEEAKPKPRAAAVPEGRMPEGKMVDSVKPKLHLEGFPDCGTILIEYSFPNGTQGEGHPAPEQPYKGTFRRAFLPDNQEGRRVLDLLKKAFRRKLTFELVQSGAEEWGVEFADIPHKTSLRGGPERHGYPDSGYLNTVRDKLEGLGLQE